MQGPHKMMRDRANRRLCENSFKSKTSKLACTLEASLRGPIITKNSRVFLEYYIKAICLQVKQKHIYIMT